MGMLSTRGRTCRALVAPVLCLSLTIALGCLSGCAAGRGGSVSLASPEDCMAPSNPQPWWQTYPCNLKLGF